MINFMKHQRHLALLATIVGSGIVFLDGTVVNLALPSISKDLGASFAQLQWIADGYLLSLSSLILLGGSLGDILGRKQMFLFGLYGFGAISLLCGLAPNSETLIVFRILQGVFGALLVPGSLAIINTNFPQGGRGRAIGQWSAWAGAFTAIGPFIGGYLIDTASWRYIFYINVPLVLVCIVLTMLGVQETKDLEHRQIDFSGAAIAALALAGITYGLIEGPANKWHAGAFIPLIVGAIFAGIFVVVEKDKKDPMVSLRLFKSQNFTGSNLMTFAMYGALSGFMFALVIYLQTKMHYSAIKAGLSLLPVTLIMLSLSGRMGALSAKYEPRRFMSVGPIIAGIGILLLINLQPGDGYLTYLLPRVFLFGLGLVTTVAPLTTTVMSSVPGEDSGIASAINNAVSRVGGLVVIAVLGILGAEHVYKFSMLLCGILAILAGIISYLTIVSPKKPVASD
jgi:EmrB/QacA subfamily drug resistance transporter